MEGQELKKIVIIISIVLVFITITILICTNEIWYNKVVIVMSKETAIKIGKAILEEHYPDVFENKEIILDAIEINGNWKVYNVIEREQKTKDGKEIIIMGGEVYVEFRKDGKIIKVGLDD